MTSLAELGLRNRRTVSLDELPSESMEAFRQSILDAVRAGWRVVAFFGMPEDDRVRLLAILALDDRGMLSAVSTIVGGSYPSLTPDCSQIDYFEREIAERCGVVPSWRLCLKPVCRPS